ncbi:MAG: hypothetical protein HYX27_10545 [Acidobacteria bacterium]|nr:hypothetical protein [Acidobacteriota bacterium]
MRLQPVLLSVLLSASAALAADSALLNLVMPEARMVAGIDVERARDSFLGRKMLEQIDSGKDGEFAKFVAMTGFDPRRDLREIIFATPDTNTKNPPALIVVRGAFDTSKINGFLKVSGAAAAENLGGIDFYTKADSKEDMGFAFLDSSLAVAGSKETVRAALKRRGGSGSAMTAATYSKVQSMSRGNDIWMVTSIPVAELSNALPGGKHAPQAMMGGDAFKAIEQAAMGIHFSANQMDLTAEAVSRTEKDATGIADVIRFLSTMVQMNREKPEVKALAEALDAMKLTTDARTTRLTISLPTAEMEKMFDQRSKPAPAKKI